MPEPRRYVVLDAYRYIAAAGVVMYHNEANFAPFLAGHVERLGRLTHLVDFFFVLSGFVLMHTYGDSVRGWGEFRAFMRKRIARVYPLHFATTMIFIAAAGVFTLAGFHLRNPAVSDPALFAPTLALLHAWGTTTHPGLDFPSWSISAEFFVYLAFPALALVLARVKPLGALALAVAFALAMEATRSCLGLRSWTLATFDYGMLRAVPTFFAGMATCAIVRALPARRISFAPAHALMAVIFLMMLAQAPAAATIALFPFAVGLIALAERGGAASALKTPFWAMLGDASYGVYLLHMFVQIAAVQAVRRFALTSPAEIVAVSIVVLVIATIAAIVSYRWFENPARRRLSRPWFARPRAELAHGEPAP
jgi:peptidoglycan/LPS O-acetylase OafA/YrhL